MGDSGLRSPSVATGTRPGRGEGYGTLLLVLVAGFVVVAAWFTLTKDFADHGALSFDQRPAARPPARGALKPAAVLQTCFPTAQRSEGYDYKIVGGVVDGRPYYACYEVDRAGGPGWVYSAKVVDGRGNGADRRVAKRGGAWPWMGVVTGADDLARVGGLLVLVVGLGWLHYRRARRTRFLLRLVLIVAGFVIAAMLVLALSVPDPWGIATVGYVAAAMGVTVVGGRRLLARAGSGGPAIAPLPDLPLRGPGPAVRRRPPRDPAEAFPRRPPRDPAEAFRQALAEAETLERQGHGRQATVVRERAAKAYLPVAVGPPRRTSGAGPTLLAEAVRAVPAADVPPEVSLAVARLLLAALDARLHLARRPSRPSPDATTMLAALELLWVRGRRLTRQDVLCCLGDLAAANASRLGEAIGRYRAAAEAGSPDAPERLAHTLARRGREHLSMGKPRLAMACLDEACSFSPDPRYRLLAALVRYLEGGGDGAQLRALLDPGWDSDSDPGRRDRAVWRSVLLLEDGRREEAISALSAVLADDADGEWRPAAAVRLLLASLERDGATMAKLAQLDWAHDRRWFEAVPVDPWLMVAFVARHDPSLASALLERLPASVPAPAWAGVVAADAALRAAARQAAALQLDAAERELVRVERHLEPEGADGR